LQTEQLSDTDRRKHEEEERAKEKSVESCCIYNLSEVYKELLNPVGVG